MPEPIAADLIKLVLDHFFPEFNEWLKTVADPRLAARISYSKEHLIHLGLCMFLFHSGSRSQLEKDQQTFRFYKNLLVLCRTDEERLATVEAMNYFMEISNPGQGLESLPGDMVYKLIRSRALDRYRNQNGEFMVAIDGVHLYTRKGKHPHCVHKTINGEVHSCYCALEAKIVTGDGMGLSLMTMFVETEEEYVKEDCELNALYRLLILLKRRFPHLRFCLLLDGLYANQFVPKICERNKWGYFITLKQGKLPSVYAEAMAQMSRKKEQAVDHSPERGVYQHLSWALNLKYKGNHFHVLRCEETQTSINGIEKRCFVWITDARPDKTNAAKLAEEARCRWVVEEMFNIQKNGGYELEHNYGTVGFAMKNYYFLMQIAHLLHQLMVRTDLFPKLQRKFVVRECGELGIVPELLAAVAATTLEFFGTIKNFVKRLGESFRFQGFSELATDPGILGRIQVRFNSS